MGDTSSHVVADMYAEARREVAQLHVDLALARQVAMKWEVEAHALRRQLDAIRQERGSDTERLERHVKQRNY